MAKNKKATFPIWAATLENVANKRPDKDQLNNNLSVRKDQSDSSLGRSAVSQRSRILTHLKTYDSLTTLQGLRELNILRPAARINELRKAGYQIKRYWTDDLTSEGHSHRVAKYVLLKSRQLSLFDWQGQEGGAA